jgi:hypothetical protein
VRKGAGVVCFPAVGDLVLVFALDQALGVFGLWFWCWGLFLVPLLVMCPAARGRRERGE